MRLITWNCQGAFRKKADSILHFEPDILIVQECENPDKLIFNSTTRKSTSFFWFGDNQHKGLAVFSYGDYKLELIDNHNPSFKLIVPILVSSGQFKFTLIAIWANNPQDKYNRYIEQIWKAINYYDTLLNEGSIILAGDFNSNQIWDKRHRRGNQTSVVNRLIEKSIHSIYHKSLNFEQGKELHPTFHLQKNQNKPYHIDYCFVSTDIYSRFTSLEIGMYEKWISISDHVPLIIDFA